MSISEPFLQSHSKFSMLRVFIYQTCGMYSEWEEPKSIFPPSPQCDKSEFLSAWDYANYIAGCVLMIQEQLLIQY